MARVYDYMPELEGEELLYVNKVLETMDDAKAQTFTNIYRARRKDATTILILTIIGFFGVAGIHRILLGQIGFGILYLLTAGLCFIGTIVDVINYKSLTFDHNREIALEITQLMK